MLPRALVFGQTDECDKTTKEATETFFHGSIGQRPRFIEDALRSGYEKPPLRPKLGTRLQEPKKRMRDQAAHACRAPCRARVAEELQRRRGTRIGEHLKLVLTIIDRQVH